MKKIYLTLTLVMLAVLGIRAQVTTLEQLSNQKAYTIASVRCFFQVIDGYDSFVTSNGSVEGIVTEANAASANQQFAILKGDSDYYLYSIGAQKFINSDGTLSAAPGMNTAASVSVGSNADYPFMINFSGDYINTQESGSGYDNGYVINSWSIADDGNQFKVIEAADVDLAAAISAIDNYEHNSISVTVHYSLRYEGKKMYYYETTLKGAAPLTIDFDAPYEFLGATCTEGTRASEVANESKTIDVVYDYTLNADVLPFVPATLTADSTFATGTKWYYLSPVKKTNYAYYDATFNKNNGGLVQSKNMTTAPSDAKYLFTFTGNPLEGYQIRSYAAGAKKGAAVAKPSDPSALYVNEAASSFLVEAGSNDGQYRFHFADYDETGLAYIEAYYDELDVIAYSWDSGWASYAASESTAQMYIQEVSDDIMKLIAGGQVTITGTDPAEGNVMNLSQINITFDTPITRVYGFDSEGGPMDGEDEPLTIALVDANGENVATFKYEDEGNTYKINGEKPEQITLTLAAPLTTNGTYTLQIPKGLAYSANGLTNAAKNLAYTITGFETVTVTARVYNAAFGDFTGDAWPAPLLPYDETFGYYSIKAQVNSKQEVVFLSHTGTTGEDLKVNFNPEDGSISLINGSEPDNYGSYWCESDVLDGNYSGYYIYYKPSYCNIDFNTEDGVGHGTAMLQGIEYDNWKEYYMFIEFYLDNRFANNSLSIGVESTAFHEGSVPEALKTISITFERELTDVASDKQITLVNEAGKAFGGTITYAQNADNKAQIDITLGEEIVADGTYILTVPSGIGIREADTNPGYTDEYILIIKVGTGSAATWTQKATDYIPDGCENPLFAEGGKFDGITVSYYEDIRTYVIGSFMGDADHMLTITTDAEGKVTKINGKEPDDYGSMEAFTGNADFYFAYIYPDRSTFNLNKDSGYVQLQGYYYTDINDNGEWYTYSIKWGEGETGISSASVAAAPAGTMYNLAGQQVSAKALKPGIYVKNGKKVIVK